MKFDPCLEICALAFLLMVTFFFFSKGNLYTLSGKLYGAFLCIMLGNLVFDIGSAYTITYSMQVPLWWNMFVNTGLFILQIALPGMFMVYIMGLTGCLGRTRKDLLLCLILMIPCLCAIGMIFGNLFVGSLFYFDAEMQYVRGNAFDSLYGIVAFYYDLWPVFPLAVSQTGAANPVLRHCFLRGIACRSHGHSIFFSTLFIDWGRGYLGTGEYVSDIPKSG